MCYPALSSTPLYASLICFKSFGLVFIQVMLRGSEGYNLTLYRVRVRSNMQLQNHIYLSLLSKKFQTVQVQLLLRHLNESSRSINFSICSKTFTTCMHLIKIYQQFAVLTNQNYQEQECINDLHTQFNPFSFLQKCSHQLNNSPVQLSV